MARLHFMDSVKTLHQEWTDSRSFTAGMAYIRAAVDITDEHPAAREVCFEILRREPDNALVRLWLARLFYLDEYFEFSLRELQELKRRGLEGSLDKLLRAFGAQISGLSNQAAPAASGPPPTEIVAEVDLDADFLDAISDIDTEKS